MSLHRIEDILNSATEPKPIDQKKAFIAVSPLISSHQVYGKKLSKNIFCNHRKPKSKKDFVSFCVSIQFHFQ